MGQQPPWTDIGNMQSDVIKIKTDLRDKVNKYEITSLNIKVGALVNAVSDVSTICDVILSRLQACEEKLQTRNQ